jgi:hypothetical protein
MWDSPGGPRKLPLLEWGSAVEATAFRPWKMRSQRERALARDDFPPVPHPTGVVEAGFARLEFFVLALYQGTALAVPYPPQRIRALAPARAALPRVAHSSCCLRGEVRFCFCIRARFKRSLIPAKLLFLAYPGKPEVSGIPKQRRNLTQKSRNFGIVQQFHCKESKQHFPVVAKSGV